MDSVGDMVVLAVIYLVLVMDDDMVTLAAIYLVFLRDSFSPRSRFSIRLFLRIFDNACLLQDEEDKMIDQQAT